MSDAEKAWKKYAVGVSPFLGYAEQKKAFFEGHKAGQEGDPKCDCCENLVPRDGMNILCLECDPTL